MTREELLKFAKPILFNTEMVRAILDERKSMTRRCVKFKGNKNPNWTGYILDGLNLYNGNNEICNKKLPFKPGDILYVRETWAPFTDYASCGRIINTYAYRADDEKYFHGISMNVPVTAWHPSIHMPREAARIFLKVTDVRVERLHEITAEGALHEGCGTGSEIDPSSFSIPDEWYTKNNLDCDYDRASFAALWQSTIPKKQLDTYGWDANPFVWVIEFDRLDG